MKSLQEYTERLLMLVFVLVVIIFYHLFTFREQPPELVSVDITTLSKEWILELASSDKKAQSNSNELSSRLSLLKEVLKEEANNQNWIILPSQNILEGTQDVTPFIKEIFYEKMQEE